LKYRIIISLDSMEALQRMNVDNTAETM